MLYFSWELELVSNILWVIVAINDARCHIWAMSVHLNWKSYCLDLSSRYQKVNQSVFGGLLYFLALFNSLSHRNLLKVILSRCHRVRIQFAYSRNNEENLTDNFNTALSYSIKRYLVKLRKFPWTLLVTIDISKNLFFQKTSFQRN